jgi:hypothetical protein
MKKILFTTALLATTLFATDYNSMSIDELQSLKGSVPTDQREDFRAAMQSKMGTLTSEQRSQYQGSKGQSQGQGQMLRDGSGGGNMYKGSRSGGGGNGGGRR